MLSHSGPRPRLRLMPRRRGRDVLDQPRDSDDAALSEIAVSVALTSFLSGACLFFMGLLLSSESDPPQSRAALGMLFVAALGFLFSTLIYANASGEVVRLRTTSFSHQMAVANALSEYLGVYPLVFASPLAVLAFTDDATLAVFFLCAAAGGVIL